MANLNLSEFGEKLFVADADHTFIWDTANAISKRVSRNSWLNSGTLTSDAPVTISQTWNNAAVAFTGLKVNATSTNSAAASLLLDLQVGGATKFKVDKTSVATLGVSGGSDNSALYFGGANYSISLTRHATGLDMGVGGDNRISFGLGGGQILLSGRSSLAWSDGSVTNTGTVDTIILRDAANTLALRNGAAAQTFNVYGTYTSGASYARLAIACDTSGNATLTTQSTGTAGTVSINGVAVGRGAGNISTNVAVGNGALRDNTTGATNSAFGASALQNNLNSSSNSAFGSNSLFANQYGGLNSAFGVSAGRFIADGSTGNISGANSLYLGANTKPLADSQTNQIVIGYDATGIGSNSVVLGNDSITKTALKGNVGIGTTAPRTKLHLEDTSTNTLVEFSGPTVRNFTAVGFAPNVGTNTCGRIGQSSVANGGLAAYGFTSNTNAVPAVTFQGNLGSASPTIAAIYFDSYKSNGSTGRVALAATEISSQFANGDSPLMTVLGGGNVGIGTTSPSSKLHVNGAIIQKPDTSATPATNGDLVVEATSNTLLTFKLKGTDGTVRTGTIALV